MRPWCAALIALAACEDARSTKPPAPVEPVAVVATEIECRENFSGGRTIGGSYACAHALKQFLVEHSDGGMLGVVPIEATAPEPASLTDVVKPGTQSLIIIHHAGEGPGIPMGQLKVETLGCNDDSRPIKSRPQDCRAALHAWLEYYDFERTALWVPLTGGATPSGDVLGTQGFLLLQPVRPTDSAPGQLSPRDGGR